MYVFVCKGWKDGRRELGSSFRVRHTTYTPTYAHTLSPLSHASLLIFAQLRSLAISHLISQTLGFSYACADLPLPRGQIQNVLSGISSSIPFTLYHIDILCTLYVFVRRRSAMPISSAPRTDTRKLGAYWAKRDRDAYLPRRSRARYTYTVTWTLQHGIRVAKELCILNVAYREH